MDNITPFCREFPAELLQEIFLFVVAHTLFPWTLASVCHQWMYIVTSLPNQWSHIMLITGDFDMKERYDIEWFFGVKKYRNDEYLVAISLAQFKHLLNWKAQMVLRISIDKVTSPILDIIFSPNNIKRIDQLHVQKSASIASTNQIYYIPNLISLSLPKVLEPWLVALLRSIGSPCALRSLSVADLQFLSFDSPSWPWWGSLTTLYMARTYRPPGSILDADLFNHICSLLVNIVKIEGLPDFWPNAGTPVTSWPNVKYIFLHPTETGWDHLELLGLETLCVTFSSSSPDIPTHTTLYYPKLLQLNIQSENTTWLSSLKAPNLERFQISLFFPRRADIEFDLTFESVRDVSCNFPGTCSPGWLTRTFPNLSKLELGYKVHFLNRVLQDVAEDASLLPHMTELRLPTPRDLPHMLALSAIRPKLSILDEYGRKREGCK